MYRSAVACRPLGTSPAAGASNARYAAHAAASAGHRWRQVHAARHVTASASNAATVMPGLATGSAGRTSSGVSETGAMVCQR